MGTAIKWDALGEDAVATITHHVQFYLTNPPGNETPAAGCLSLAQGTGDLDCVYHFALPELKTAVTIVGSSDQLEMLTAMIEGRRLRDISDLPLDLAV
jgi:hypothetical protein